MKVMKALLFLEIFNGLRTSLRAGSVLHDSLRSNPGRVEYPTCVQNMKYGDTPATSPPAQNARPAPVPTIVPVSSDLFHS